MNEPYIDIKERELKAQIKRMVEDKVIGSTKKYNKENKLIMKRYYETLQLKFGKEKYHTKKAYLQHLRSLILALDKDLKQTTRQDIKQYLLKINEELKPRTIRERKIFLLTFYPYLMDKSRDELRKDLLKDVILTKDLDNLTEKPLLEPKDITKLLGVTPNFRNQAIISLLYESGARKGELLRLRIKHVDLDKKMVIIPQGKTVSREIPIIDSVPYLSRWIDTHPEKDNPNAPLWINQGSHLGRAFHEDGLKRLIKILIGKAKLKKHITPHSFRHSKATEFAKQGVNEAFLRKWFGWSKTSKTPSLYIHLFSQDLSNMYQELKGVKQAQKRFIEEKQELMPKICPNCKTENIPSYLRRCPNVDCNYSFELEQEEEVKQLKDQLEAMKIFLLKSKDFRDYVNSRKK